METFIRTPDMPGVHQETDALGVMPPDYNISSIVESTNSRSIDPTGRILSVDPDTNAKRLHASYNDFIDAVNKCMETGAGLVWESYQDFINLKSGNTTKFNDAVAELKNNASSGMFCAFHTRLNNLTEKKALKEELLNEQSDDVSAECSFKEFVLAILRSNPNADIPHILTDNYKPSIAALRYQLQTMNSNFKFDVENSIEYTVHNKTCLYSVSQLSSIAFKVKPYLEGISASSVNDVRYSIPVVGYKICIDMHKLIVWMLSNCKLPDELPPALESSENVKEEYVKSVIGEYPSFSEKIARRIVMEVYDSYYNIQGNWGHFLNKFMNSYNKLVSDPDLANLIDKVEYLSNMERDDPATLTVSDDRANELLVKILSKVNSLPTADELFISQLYTTIASDFTSGKGDYIINQAVVLFKKTFSVFFEDAVLLNFEPLYQNEHYSKQLILTGYSREFNKIYDLTDLLGKASTISNYNDRDFIQTILSEVKQLKCMSYDSTKLANGELAFFMYSKFSRNIWLNVTNSVILASNLVSMMETVSPSEQETSVYNKIKRTLQSFVDFVYSNLIRITSEARYIPSNRPYFYLSSGSFVQVLKLKHMLDYCKEYTKSSFGGSCKLDGLLVNKTKSSSELRVPVLVDTSYIVSYDVSDESEHNTLKENIKKALKERSIISYDF